MNKILVTGAGGFIGAHLTEKLMAGGHEVRAFIHYNSMGSRGNLELSSCKNEVEFHEGDIRDFDSVNRAMKGCDSVFHLAALIGIPYSYVSPLAYVKTNIEGTYNVLENARRFETRNVIIVSTSETYGTAQYVPIDERHPLVPQSPYAASKSAAEQLALAYHRSFGTRVKVVKPFNVYGPRQSARAIVPTIITQALTGDRIFLGALQPTRDLTYVADMIEGFVKIAHAQACTGLVTNLGTGLEISVGELAKKILSIMGKNMDVATDPRRVRPQESEVERLCADISRARQLIGWKPGVAFADGLRMTIDWVAAHLEHYRLGVYNI
jgi:NAD dependent epimerase/dehydratase